MRTIKGEGFGPKVRAWNKACAAGMIRKDGAYPHQRPVVSASR